MAARANAGRRPAAPRRRPARRPAPRQGVSRIKWDRVGRVALTLVLAAVLYSYLNPALDFVKTYTATSGAKERLHELQAENTLLHARVQSASDQPVIERRARSLGLVEEGERPVVIRGLNN